MKNLFHPAADTPASRLMLPNFYLPNASRWEAAPKRRPAAAFTGAAVILSIGALAATFIISGEQTPAAATDTFKAAASTATPEILPTRKVRTTRIEIAPRPEKQASQSVGAPADQAKAEIPPLTEDDPRWARLGPSVQTDAESRVAARMQAGATDEAETPAEIGNLDLPAPPDERSTDPLATAAISRNEERQREREAAAPETLVSVPEQPEAEAEPAPTRTARVNQYVNMRTRPADGARSVLVIPAKASVGVIGCKSWCEVTYKGNRGWIYKSFIGKGGAARRSSAKPAPAEAADAAKPAPAAAPKTAQAPVGIWNKIRENQQNR